MTTIAANASTSWVGEAMQAVDHNDHNETPEKTAGTTTMAARQALYLAALLQHDRYAAHN